MGPRDPYDPPPEGRTEIVEEDVGRAGPPPWWREHWWLGPLALLLAVGAILAFAYLGGDDDEEAADQTTVPAVVGMQEPEARERLVAAGLEVDVTRVESGDPEGRVLAQEPGGGAGADEGQTVELTVSNGEGEAQTQTETATETETQTTTAPAATEPPETETVTQTETVETEPEPTDMPGLVGTDYREASDAILDAGLLPTSYPVASDEEQATVVAQNPAEGTALNEGTTVRMNVSLGPGGRAAGTVPDLRDGEAGEALRQCHQAGYTCRLVDRGTTRAQSKGRIIGQEPAPGASAPSLTQITLAVGR